MDTSAVGQDGQSIPSANLTRPASDTPQEVELRLLAEPAALDALDQDEALQAGTTGAVKHKHQVGTYFDTEDRRMRRRGVDFRVRRIGNSFVQTVKAKGGDQAGPLSRNEWETAITGPEPDLAALAGVGAAEVTGVLLPGDLHPLFVTDVRRTVRTVAYDAGGKNASLIEVAADRGAVRLAGGAEDETSTPISELELELKAGKPDALFDLALALNERHAVRVGFAGKADRGYALLSGKQAGPQTAAKVALQPDWTVDQSMGSVFRACFSHWIANEKPAELGSDPEGVHQLRVSLRRLRTALSLFSPALSELDRTWLGGEAKWLAGSLGPARDWDVFIGEMMPDIAEAGYEQELAPLLAAAEARQKDAYAQVREVIGSPRYTRLLLEFWRWLEGNGWRSTGLEMQRQPVVALADQVLAKQQKRVLKKGRGFAKLSLPDRHEVRIAVKKLRYSVEFFASLFPGEKSKRYRRRLSGLQDALGAMNDAAVADTLLDQVVGAMRPGKAAVPLARAAGLVSGWYTRGRIDEDAELVASWQAFRRAKPFWHDLSS
ncbi:MAG: CYTH and CHAD domain-containing protein [Pseudomonadota bacterium]